MSEAACERQHLVRKGPFQIDRCGCGTLHLTMGYCTLRLPPAAAELLCIALLEAVQQVERRSATAVQ